MTDPLYLLSDELAMMYYCLNNLTDTWSTKLKKGSFRVRLLGGHAERPSPMPIYFQDPDYRKAKHEAMTRLIQQDEEDRQQRLGLTALDKKLVEARRAVDELIRQQKSLPVPK